MSLDPLTALIMVLSPLSSDLFFKFYIFVTVSAKANALSASDVMSTGSIEEVGIH